MASFKALLVIFLSLSAAVESAKLNESELRSTIKRAMERCGVPGMGIAILHKNQIVFADGFGKRNKDDPYTLQTVQPIGSLTKAFTATTIGELVAEGKVDWDTTSVSKYLPDFQLKDPILTSQLTFADMLSHHTGFPNNMLSWHKTKDSRRDLIKRLRYVDDIPRKLTTTMNYNNVIYAVAGEAAAHVAGTSYEDLVFDKVIRPLGLNKTGFSPINMKRLHPDNYALPHEAISYEAAEKGQFVVLPLDDIYMAYSPAGDAYSNVLDLVRWGKAVMDLGVVDGKQVLNGTSVEETLKAHTIAYGGRRGTGYGAALTYGFGWLLDSYKGHVFYRHNGATSGFTADLVMFPHDDLVIASTSNIVKVSQIGDYIPLHIADVLFDLPINSTFDWIEEMAVPEVKGYYTAMKQLGQGFLPPQIPNKPATFANNLSAYVGEYADPLFGKFVIGLEKKKDPNTGKEIEVLTYKYNEFASTLEHYHYDAFVATLDDPLLRFRALMTFSADPVKGGEKGGDKKKRPIMRMQIQELPAGTGISKKIFKKRH
ncbi:hypothetical protein BG015_005731 [Linnemannia schmuckeri]|uniref:Beta-lactamase-related domain-containing protein n=1 Tax=Linnemannia schmuckeri TaxID=64567 RepID=A0A9P5VCF6_9FUNG|nr:hypothetical protein BG015_005731 [Linnemannia schmuckeri]